jgi:uncharacterized protein
VEPCIQNLVDLQRVDARVQLLSAFVDKLPELRAALAAERQAAEDLITAERDKLDHAKKSLRKKEAELKDGEEKLKQTQARLNQVKTNKEYEAALKEMEDRKRGNGDVEVEILELYDQVEAAENEKASLEAGWKERAADFDRQQATLEAKAKAALAELAERQGERDGVLAVMDADLLGKYNLVKTKISRPVVRADKEVCLGCNTHVPPQLYNQVLKADKAIHCPSCQRLLVHPACNLVDDAEDY